MADDSGAAESRPPAAAAAKLQRYQRELAELVAAASAVPHAAEMDYRLELDDDGDECPQSSLPSGSARGQEVPEELVPVLAKSVQGFDGTLAEAAALASSAMVRERRRRTRQEGDDFWAGFPDLEAIGSKIRLVLERRAYGPKTRSCVVFEDRSPEALWRWEVASLDWFASKESVAKVREAKAARSSLGNRIKALKHLVDTLNKHPDDAGLISNAEVRVDKSKQEDEKRRQKLLQRKAKQAAKARTSTKAADATQASANEQEAQEQRTQDDASSPDAKPPATKRKSKEHHKPPADGGGKSAALMKRFFSVQPPPAKKARPASAADDHDASSSSPTPNSSSEQPQQQQQQEEDAPEKKNDFDLNLEALPPMGDFRQELRELNERVAASKRQSDGGGGVVGDEGLPSEVIIVGDEAARDAPFKFLKFFEDYRPPFCGPCAKTSDVVTPTRPFARDPNVDYDYDSDAEFEENDAEVDDAESIADDDDDDEDDDDEDDHDDDGFFIGDDDLLEGEAGLAQAARRGGGGGDTAKHTHDHQHGVVAATVANQHPHLKEYRPVFLFELPSHNDENHAPATPATTTSWRPRPDPPKVSKKNAAKNRRAAAAAAAAAEDNNNNNQVSQADASGSPRLSSSSSKPSEKKKKRRLSKQQQPAASSSDAQAPPPSTNQRLLTTFFKATAAPSTAAAPTSQPAAPA